MARMHWEKAAQQDHVRIAGSERAERQVISRPPRAHRWSEWAAASKPDTRWRRQCAKCKRVEFRVTRPTASELQAPERRVRVARTKGDLRVRRVDGTARVVAAKDATRAAREALTAAAQRAAERESVVAPGSVRKAVVKRKQPAKRFKKTEGESSIDRVFRGGPVAKAAQPVAQEARYGGRKKGAAQPTRGGRGTSARSGRPGEAGGGDGK